MTFLLAGFSCLNTACQSASPARPVPPVIPVEVPASSRPVPALSDSRASYHFLLGYQAELEQETERAIKEYQLALQTDAASSYLKARLAVLYFTKAMHQLIIRRIELEGMQKGFSPIRQMLLLQKNLAQVFVNHWIVTHQRHGTFHFSQRFGQ